MQWSPDRNAAFSKADADRRYLPLSTDLVYGYQAVNVEQQERISTSLLNDYKRLNTFRKEHPVLALGSYQALDPHHPSPYVNSAKTRKRSSAPTTWRATSSRSAWTWTSCATPGWTVYDALGGERLGRIERGRRYEFPLAAWGALWLRLERPPSGRG